MDESGWTRARDFPLRPRAKPLIGATLGAALAALSGCGSSPRESFDLSLGSPKSAAIRVAGPTLAVAEPKALSFIDSNRLLIRGADGDLSYLADAQWADRLPRLVQARLVERLARSGIDAVQPAGVITYQLATDLKRFEIDSARGVAVVEITARLLNNRSGARIGEADFLGEAPASHTMGREAAFAFETALNDAAAQLAAWSGKRL